MKNTIVVGAQWGDEGKGKVVDLYSANAEYIVRFQGGNNAGHTLVIEGKKTVLHLIPSGALQPNKICLIGNGVAFDPNVFFEEVESLQKAGVFTEKAEESVRVSERAHVILPYHRLLDRLREEHAEKKQGKIGTTVRGIGPTYEDKTARRGIQVVDLLKPDVLRAKLEATLEEKNALLKHLFNHEEMSVEEVFQECVAIGKRLEPYIADTRKILTEALSHGRPILFEGAQGTLLDVDHGTYPFVTSSNTVSAEAFSGTGLGPISGVDIIGITKAYTTRVGKGPFPTEMEVSEPEVAERIRSTGLEFGATTGRPRRTGWLDLVALKYAAEVNGLTGIALMKADVLNGLNEVKLCTSYRVGSRSIYDFPSSIEDLEAAEPSYEILPGWGTFNSLELTERKDLPKELQTFMKTIEDFLGIPIVLLSTGPGREESLILSEGNH